VKLLLHQERTGDAKIYWLAGPFVLATPIRSDGTFDLQDSDSEIVDSEGPDWDWIYDALTALPEEEVEEALIETPKGENDDTRGNETTG
jgi:hypothetical protein